LFGTVTSGGQHQTTTPVLEYGCLASHNQIHHLEIAKQAVRRVDKGCRLVVFEVKVANPAGKDENNAQATFRYEDGPNKKTRN
jgi:hypothetical protein